MFADSFQLRTLQTHLNRTGNLGLQFRIHKVGTTDLQE